MIFPSLSFEKIIQVGDKLRLDAQASFATKEITNVEIEPSTGAGFLSVYSSNKSNWYLDWGYAAAGSVAVSVRVTDEDALTETKTFELEVISKEDDDLFSDDNDLYVHDQTIKRLLPAGKNSFIFAHRAAKDKIVTYLDEQKIWKYDGTRFSNNDKFNNTDFKRWSTFQALMIIYESNQVRTDDVFQEKKMDAEKEMIQARNRATLRLDFNNDGEVDEGVYQPMQFGRLIRR